MTEHKWGSREYYKQAFSDYLADISADDASVTNSLVQGFFDALQDWRDYHIHTCSEFNRAIRLATDIANDQNQNIQSGSHS